MGTRLALVLFLAAMASPMEVIADDSAPALREASTSAAPENVEPLMETSADTDVEPGAESVGDTDLEDAHSTARLPHDLSPWGMFMGADQVVKSVMVGLALASMLTWTVFVVRRIELSALKRRLAPDVRQLTRASALNDVRTKSKIGTELVEAARAELALSSDAMDKEGVKERVSSSLSRLEAAFARKLIAGTGLLATIGATAPFVGLFGTVWGIMNAFIGISKANTTNLAIVAPGIAEALLATALGLVAAIPAVVIYNHFSRRIATVKATVSDMSAAILRLVSRDLDRDTISASRRRAAE